jgi:NADH-quinone oxidoreductase subunit J
MISLFYSAGAIALLATVLAISRRNAVHALLYLVVSFMAIAGVMLALGAAFAAALEIMVYAGAIMVLFVFVVMLLNIGPQADAQEAHWIRPQVWLGPSLLTAALLAELLLTLRHGTGQVPGAQEVTLKALGLALYGPYLLAVELASMLLLAGLIAAFHLGRPRA